MEYVNVFDEQHVFTRIASRDEVHAKGLWHETFHCWLYDETHLYFQLRSAQKKDYANLFDITAAGHLEAHEAPIDGLREVEEELGITLRIDDVVKVGILRSEIVQPHMMDREFCHVFIAPFTQSYEAFSLQVDEVQGIAKASIDNVQAFVAGTCETIQLEGFYEKNGSRHSLKQAATREHFVSFRGRYFDTLLTAITQQIERATSL